MKKGVGKGAPKNTENKAHERPKSASRAPIIPQKQIGPDSSQQKDQKLRLNTAGEISGLAALATGKTLFFDAIFNCGTRKSDSEW